MTILLTLYLAGMPVSLVFLLWAFWGAPTEDLIEVGTLSGIAAVVVFVLLWPVFVGLSVYDVMTER